MGGIRSHRRIRRITTNWRQCTFSSLAPSTEEGLGPRTKTRGGFLFSVSYVIWMCTWIIQTHSVDSIDLSPWSLYIVLALPRNQPCHEVFPMFTESLKRAPRDQRLSCQGIRRNRNMRWPLRIIAPNQPSKTNYNLEPLRRKAPNQPSIYKVNHHKWCHWGA